MTLSNPAQYISGRTVQEQMNSLIDYVDQRAAEVATDAIASDVAQVHSDAADAHTDALAAAASASQASTTLANAVKKTGEASQSIAGDIAVAGALSGGSVSSSGNVDGTSIGSGTTPVVCGDLTAFGSVSLDDTTLQGNLGVADPSALINLGGAGSVVVPTPTSNNEAATKKYVDDQDALDVHLSGNQTVAGVKTFSSNPVGPTEATGTFSTKLATSDKVKNELDNYAPMVRTTGNQNIAGTKSFTGTINGGNELSNGGGLIEWADSAISKIQLKHSTDDFTESTASIVSYPNMSWRDKNGYFIAYITSRRLTNGAVRVDIIVRNADGTEKTVTLAEGNP